MYTFEDYFRKHEIKYVDPFFKIIKETHIGIRDMIWAQILSSPGEQVIATDNNG